MRQRRLAVVGRLVAGYVRQLKRQLILRQSHIAALVALDDRNRLAPVTLTGEYPVTQLVLHLGMADALFAQPLDHSRDSVLNGLAVEKIRVDQNTGLILCGKGCLLDILAAGNNLDNLTAELLCKLPVTVIVRRNSHDGTGAVAHQNIVGNENRDLLAVYWIDCGNAVQLNAGLVLIQLGALEVGLAGSLLTVCANVLDVVQLVCPLLDHRVLRGDYHIGRAEQGVRTGGVNGQRIALSGLEIDLSAGGTADPVALLNLNAFNIIHIFQIVDQTLCVLGDGEHPLALGLVNDLAAAALTNAVDNLLVRQNALAGGTPVYAHFLLVGQALLEQLQENPLGPLVVARVSGVDLTRPVERQTEALELALEAGDVLLGDLCRMHMVLDGKVLSRQTECVPAHRIQHVVTLHALFARNDIQRGVGARMAYMQTLTGRVRELNECIELLLVRVILGMEALLLVPDVLPFLFYLFMIVLQRILPLK